MAVEWTITIEGKNEFGDVCRKAVRIDKSWERLFDGGIGLSIEDGKTIMTALQSAVVAHEAETYCLFRWVCPDCHTVRPVKDYTSRRIRTVLGTVEVGNPRWMLCRDCRPGMDGALAPASKDELSIVNRHRILRVGRGFDALGAGDPEEQKPGLLFMCLNADIERQFEFVQQTWATAWQFHGLENEVDPVTGRGGGMGRLTIPSPRGPLNLTGIKDFVRMRGGAYLFMPSKSAIRFLARL
ncbi:MAG: hypothetical protein SXG53_27450 [Pseudomonadota bacterium]|nr:hypothetical protein [Pseudomonadota bacterium]